MLQDVSHLEWECIRNTFAGGKKWRLDGFWEITCGWGENRSSHQIVNSLALWHPSEHTAQRFTFRLCPVTEGKVSSPSWAEPAVGIVFANNGIHSRRKGAARTMWRHSETRVFFQTRSQPPAVVRWLELYAVTELFQNFGVSFTCLHLFRFA